MSLQRVDSTGLHKGRCRGRIIRSYVNYNIKKADCAPAEKFEVKFCIRLCILNDTAVSRITTANLSFLLYQCLNTCAPNLSKPRLIRRFLSPTFVDIAYMCESYASGQKIPGPFHNPLLDRRSDIKVWPIVSFQWLLGGLGWPLSSPAPYSTGLSHQNCRYTVP
jgi:hypothetical protein